MLDKDDPRLLEKTAEGLPKYKRDGTLTRAARKEANRLQRKAIEVQELAATSGAPPGFVVGEQEKNAAWELPGVTRVLTAQERLDHLQGERAEQEEAGTATPRGRGRPSEYTQEEADALCGWISQGGSLRAYCRETGRNAATIYGWMREDAEFFARYSRAHEDRADTLTDEMQEIADQAAENPTIEGVAAAKLRVETRKWIASKLKPNKWGDKQVVEHKGAVNIRIGIPSKPRQIEAEVVDVKAIERS